MSRVLVMGAAGYLGQVLCPFLLEAGYKVRGLDNLMYWQDFPEGIETKFGDITSVSDMYEATNRVDFVVALAAIVGDELAEADKNQAINVNYEATKLLVEMCELNQVKKIIFTSTCSVYGNEGIVEDIKQVNPLSLYAKTRLLSEKVLAQTEIPVQILRLGTLFGWSPRMRFDLVVNYMTAKAVNDREIIIHGGEQSRPLLHVSDAANFIVQSLRKYQGSITNAVLGNYKIKDIAGAVANEVGNVNIKTEKGKDARDYQVTDDIHKAEVSLSQGIIEMRDKIKTLDKPYIDDTYYNIKAWQ